MVQCKMHYCIVLSNSIPSSGFLTIFIDNLFRKVILAVNGNFYAGEQFRLYEIDVAAMQWKGMNSPVLSRGKPGIFKENVHA